MIVIFECSHPGQLKPGRFRSKLGGRRFIRYWWLFFSVTLWPGDLQEYGDAVRGAEWIKERK